MSVLGTSRTLCICLCSGAVCTGVCVHASTSTEPGQGCCCWQERPSPNPPASVLPAAAARLPRHLAWLTAPTAAAPALHPHQLQGGTGIQGPQHMLASKRRTWVLSAAKQQGQLQLTLASANRGGLSRFALARRCCLLGCWWRCWHARPLAARSCRSAWLCSSCLSCLLSLVVGLQRKHLGLQQDAAPRNCA